MSAPQAPSASAPDSAAASAAVGGAAASAPQQHQVDGEVKESKSKGFTSRQQLDAHLTQAAALISGRIAASHVAQAFGHLMRHLSRMPFVGDTVLADIGDLVTTWLLRESLVHVARNILSNQDTALRGLQNLEGCEWVLQVFNGGATSPS